MLKCICALTLSCRFTYSSFASIGHADIILLLLLLLLLLLRQRQGNVETFSNFKLRRPRCV